LAPAIKRRPLSLQRELIKMLRQYEGVGIINATIFCGAGPSAFKQSNDQKFENAVIGRHAGLKSVKKKRNFCAICKKKWGLNIKVP
jgi:hypothetical protein